MRINPPKPYIVFTSTLFVVLLLLVCCSLRTSASREHELAANQSAVGPKMPLSDAVECSMSLRNDPEANIIPKEEWFPKPPEPEIPDDTEITDGDGVIDGDEIPPDPVTEYPLGPGPYNYNMPVPECDPVDNDHFAKALFIGDSRTVGVGNWGGVPAYYYAKVALTIRGVMTIPFIEDDIVNAEEPVLRTVIDTIREYPIFEHVYIAFGLNELGWSQTAFINTYEEVIKQIKELLPDADIYIQAVLPVSKKTSEKGTNGVTNEGVREYNSALQELAAKTEVFYLEMDKAFADENGDMPANLVAADGIHFGGDVARQVMDYVKTHVVQYDDYTWENE